MGCPLYQRQEFTGQVEFWGSARTLLEVRTESYWICRLKSLAALVFLSDR